MTRLAAFLVGCLAVCGAAPYAAGSEWPTADIAAAVEAERYDRASELLRREVERRPGDLGARFDLARVLGWAGDYAASAEQYDALIARSPGNVDYSLGRAQTLAWALRDDEALEEVGHAKALAPDYEAVWRLEAQILQRHPNRRERLSALREQARRRFPDSAWWDEARPPAPEPATIVTAGARRESLSAAAPDWSSVFVGVRRRGSETFEYHGELRRDERFGFTDQAIGGGASWRIAERLTAGGDLFFAGDAAFSPRTAAAAWASWALPRSWEAEVRVRHSRYAESAVTGIGLTAARYIGNYRLAYTIMPSHLSGASGAAAHSATLDYFHSDRIRLRVTVAGGEEIEAVGPGQVLRTDIRAVSFGLQHPLNERWSLSWELGSHEQGDLYRRRYVGVSVSAGT